MTTPVPTPFTSRTHPRTLCLFDVDGTLSLARQSAKPEMLSLLARLRKECAIGFVGGSDLSKIREQLQPKGAEDPIDLFDYSFAENGLTAYRFGKELSSESFVKSLGEERYKKLAKFCLNYIANEMEDIPVMRGTFVEFRNGMINVSPIGRNASIEERNAFELFDQKHNIRTKFISKLKEAFPEREWPLTYSIGGKISFDIFPNGWDKTYALKHVENEMIGEEKGWKEIHFFGDKTYKGGNDHEIFEDLRTIGHTVTSPEHTMKELEALFFAKESL